MLERTPPELVADISQNGIVMSGGGSLIYGIDMLVEHDTKLRTVVVDDPISCAAYGAGKMLLRLNELPEGMVNFARKRQLQNWEKQKRGPAKGPRLIFCALFHGDGAVGGDGDAHAVVDIAEELVAELIDDGHVRVRPVGGENCAEAARLSIVMENSMHAGWLSVAQAV